MKLLFDQNISYKIIPVLPDQMKGSSHIKKEGLLDATDLQIWSFAKLHNFTIVTQDSDFNDLNALYGFPPKIIWIRTGNLQTKKILEILIENSKNSENFIGDINYGCYEIFKIVAK